MIINCNISGNSEGTNQNNASDHEETRTVEHAMGVTEIEGTPETVVTLYQGANDTAAALGVQPDGIVESWTQQLKHRPDCCGRRSVLMERYVKRYGRGA
ncbi:hypothetical protein [Thalassobacillus sp. C254]|uniref:hypothetical protein n=1 Tax=Thalassobacillus sp. C254 TaxID=1225341 RepID=UPI0022B64D31|nr:hypothetical protein [Thalassobacillus sp. C254]